MKQGLPVSSFAIGFTLGCWSLQHSAILPHVGSLLAGLLLALLLQYWQQARKMRAVVSGVLIGFCWAGLHAHLQAPERLPFKLPHHALVWATGYIDSLPVQSQGVSRFVLVAKQLEFEGLSYYGNWRLQVSWYGHTTALWAGERWRLPLRIKPIRGYRNPGGFDLENWLYARQIRYRAYVSGEGQRVGQRLSIHYWRQRLSTSLSNLDLPQRTRAIIQALALGDRSALRPIDKTLFATTGTSHLMAISGLHIGLVAAWLWGIGQSIWRLFPAACVRWPAKWATVPVALLGALGYATLAGFALPAQRALLMLALYLAAFWARREWRAFDLLAVSLVMILGLDPFAVSQASFWLSFGAVAILFWVTPRCATPWRWLGVQLALFVALAPVLLCQGMEWSLFSPIANWVAIPLFGFFLVPLILLGVLCLAFWPAAAQALLSEASDSLMAFLWFLQGLSNAFAWLKPNRIEAWEYWSILVVVLALAGAWRAKTFRAHLNVALLLLFLIWRHLSLPRPPPPGQFDFVLLDVGQGLSALIRTHRHVLVFDTGPAYPSGFNTVEAVLLPYLRHQGIQRIDTVILSHGDMDHIGAAKVLSSRLEIGRWLAGEPKRLAQKMGITAQACQQGQTWRWDGVEFVVLHPGDSPWKGNDASCVLRVSVGEQAVLLTGDIEARAEQALVAHYGSKLASQVVVAAHHGSKTASHVDFVQATQPQWILYAAGWHNRWGFPHETVRQRWASQGARALTTATSGAISFRFERHGISHLYQYALKNRRYWHE